MNLSTTIKNQLINVTPFINYLLDCRCHICNAKLISNLQEWREKNNLLGKDLLCPRCINSLPKISLYSENTCEICATPITKETIRCKYCQENELFAIDKTIASFIYDFPIRNLILSLKTNPNPAIAKFLAQSLYAEIYAHKIVKDFDTIIPMPMHPNRLTIRGFNQSILISKYLSKLMCIPFDINVIYKIRDSGSQEGRSRKQRFSSVKKCFSANTKVRDKNLLLLDDVMTTGASLNEIAQTLKKQGAKNCIAIVVARAVFD